jgi:penicillin-binding protein 2
MKNPRATTLLIGLGVVALLLLGRIFSIQILNPKYKRVGSMQSTQYEVVYPTRGVIYDRNGRILVGNKVAYDIMVTPQEVTQFDTLEFASLLDVDPDFVREKMAEYNRDIRKIGYNSVVMLKQIPVETYYRFNEKIYKFPGFRGQARSVREYPINAGGNLLGYVSEVDADYIKKNEGEYKPGDYAGRTGIESAREKDLRGEKGYNIYIKNSRGKIEGRYKNGELDKEAVPGKDIVTTIDAELQRYGQILMRNKVGALVAIEPSTGEILAMISSPGIDVNVLSDIGKHWESISSNPYKPMFNRAVQASYPPAPASRSSTA